MHTPAVYFISVGLFVLSGLLLFACGSSWAKLASGKSPVSKRSLRAVAGLTAASLVMFSAALLWASAVAFVLHV